MKTTLDLLISDTPRPASEWLALAKDSGPGLQTLALARAVGSGHDRAPLVTALAALPALDEAKRKTLTSDRDSRVEKMKRFGSAPGPILGAIAEAIGEGAEPSYMLRAAARTLDAWGDSNVALEYMQAALAIAPADRAWYRDTLVLILLNQARFDEAALELDRLAAIEPGQAAWMRTYLVALRQPFDDWSRTYEKQTDVEQVDPSPRSLAEVQEQVSLLAGRIESLVTALARQPRLLPQLPQVAHLEPKPGAPPLDERFGTANLLIALRKEWSRLCWLLFCVGAKDLARPSQVAPPIDPLDHLDTMVSIRFNLVATRADGETPTAEDELDEMELESEWAGAPVSELAPHLAAAWLEELSAALAAIRWAAGDIESVFEDQ